MTKHKFIPDLDEGRKMWRSSLKLLNVLQVSEYIQTLKLHQDAILYQKERNGKQRWSLSLNQITRVFS